MRRTGLAAWDSGSEGNYYSDYTGTDPDGDGIGNDPHPLPSALLTQTCSHGLRCRLATSITTTRSPPRTSAIALRLAAGGSALCDPATLAAADVSGDGHVTSLDALMILQAAGRAR